MTKRICNKCGKEIEDYNDFHVGYQFGYESKHDGDVLELDLCGKCLDEVVDRLIDDCKYSPLE